ncbi:MAG TPA: nucleotidyltransferase family protein [Flavitalea sp.]|nr:nucleotidyltransferase family protein [Flavitalea sp.]
MKIREAIVLAGGLGTRLRPAVSDVPKCLAPVAGKPFLSYVIDHFRNEGVEQFIFSLGYKHELIEDFILSEFPELSHQKFIEKEPLGTGGAVYAACGLAEEKSVLIINGDTLFRINLRKLIPFHFMTGAHCTLSLKPMQNFDRYGAVRLYPDYRVQSFEEKKFHETGNINGGVYALNATQFRKESFDEVFSFERDYLEKHLPDRRIYGVIQNEYFIDIGIPEDYDRAGKELPALK